ncbi:hypothetical protein KY495_04190 [Massilia sp. PAMC28688]|uniref:hypothetical protein n=1 Tax=Massilia sp. PAMC28688 TaxID=2861283 RepID=UPI001C6398A6|nr:hypothetical protein [Massilia sp. PAMC28688]QYF94424.1 hypothetical protein KY495_04190 [Massilia sp. PAMC28688]
MIKLQLLLRHPAPEPAIDASLRARLEQLGFQIDGCGRASVTAHMTEGNFIRLFGHNAPQAAVAPARTPDLAIPDALQEDISLITSAPRHDLTTTKGIPHASI